MDESSWWTYVLDVIGEATPKEASDRAGIDKSNFTRWKQGGRPAVEFVLKLARSYGRPVVEALAAAGYITEEEANVREVRIGVEDLSDVALSRELLRRAEARERKPHNVTHAPFGERSRTKRQRAEDLPLVANDSIDEHPDYDDADYEHP